MTVAAARVPVLIALGPRGAVGVRDARDGRRWAGHRRDDLARGGPGLLPPMGRDTEPDRPRRLRLFADAYGSPVMSADLVDLAALWLLSLGSHVEARIQADDLAFTVHREEDHGSGYRAAATYILTHHAELLG